MGISITETWWIKSKDAGEMKIFLTNWNHILNDVKKEFETVDYIEDCDCVVLWNDVGYLEKGIIQLARRFKKPVVTVQHGRKGTSRYYAPFNEKIISDKYCCWGPKDKDDLGKAGQDRTKIEITGCPILKYLKPRQKHEGINIVFSPEHWDKEVKENEKTAKALRRIAKKHKFKVITKIIEGHNKDWYDNPVFSSRGDENHLDITTDVLSKADLVVGISESTFELLAQALDIPVVIPDIWQPKPCNGDERYLTYKREYSNACKRPTMSQLENTILDQLEHPEELKKEREEICRLEGGIHIKNPIENICNIIRNTNR